jgi:organic hydroperoxide reductase OsmC/OhrA
VSIHSATVEWRCEGDFAAGRYSRRHAWRFDGGTSVAASASPDVVPVPLSDPAAIDPEEALVASAASCHMLWFLALAQREGLAVESYRDAAEGEMARIGPGRMALTRIVLRPDIAFAGDPPDSGFLARLHHEAHEKCFIANSLKAEIVVEPPVPA